MEPEPPQPQEGRKWTREEVGAHNSMVRAVIIIDNLVYDVSAFLEEHPGGAEVLLDNAGRDASQCFHDVGHSELALEWRRSFLVGELVEEDKRPVVERTPPLEEIAPERTLAGLLDVWGPPAMMALLAAAFYFYLF